MSNAKGNALPSAEAQSFRRRRPARGTAAALAPVPGGAIPEYLSAHYWWAYVHPNAVRVFERDWLVNLILWGNYARLRDAALDALGKSLPGSTLQVACAYGDLTPRLSERVSRSEGRLDVIDVLPVQLSNLQRKLPRGAPARLLRMDAADLTCADGSYDRVLLFFLLHEQPPDYRRKTLSEAFRVVKPGGRIVIVDYARPRWWNPFRYLWSPVLAALEPFALDLWRHDVATWFPDACRTLSLRRGSLFGGLYQQLVIER
jgi:ubiquinone/menaquinone biosynthesis C-methylase UbiE